MFDHIKLDQGDLLLLIATMTPNPSDETITSEMRYDKMRNPHNDHFKPELRSSDQIIADYKLKMARTLISRAQREQPE